jgi:hypothetical protein
MIAEFAIIPDVFDRSSYSSPDFAEYVLTHLAEVCREEAIVRDLCDGSWSIHVQQNSDRWHPAAKAIIETWGKQKRLRPFARVLPRSPEEDADWYYEAEASHKRLPLDGIIVRDAQCADWSGDKKIIAVSAPLESGLWERRNSVRVRRTVQDYLRVLSRVLMHAKYFTFIDPYLDERDEPERRSTYRDFSTLLQKIPNHADGTTVRVEIHVWKRDDGCRTDWEARVEKTHRALTRARRTAELFVWPLKFHDRYLITDLVGISVPNGFDTATRDSDDKTTWTRVGRHDAEEVEKEFDRNNGKYGQPYIFPIGWQQK